MEYYFKAILLSFKERKKNWTTCTFWKLLSFFFPKAFQYHTKKEWFFSSFPTSPKSRWWNYSVLWFNCSAPLADSKWKISWRHIRPCKMWWKGIIWPPTTRCWKVILRVGCLSGLITQFVIEKSGLPPLSPLIVFHAKELYEGAVTVLMGEVYSPAPSTRVAFCPGSFRFPSWRNCLCSSKRGGYWWQKK